MLAEADALRTLCFVGARSGRARRLADQAKPALGEPAACESRKTIEKKESLVPSLKAATNRRRGMRVDAVVSHAFRPLKVSGKIMTEKSKEGAIEERQSVKLNVPELEIA